jgi:DNA-directed RNA polymerase sigma subunit (sigma70/sigma32)
MSPNPVAITMRHSWAGTRAAGISTILLVFLCGMVAGALAYNLGAHKRLHREAFWTSTGKDAAVSRVKKELELTPLQVEQMETILDDFAKYYTTVLSDGKSRIMQILNDGQKKKFEQLLAEGSLGR